MNQSASRRHWEENLDPQNLGGAANERHLEREWAFYRSDEQRFAESRMPPLSGALCLELGGGLGAHALWLARRGARVVVADFAGTRLAALRREAERLGLAGRVLCVQCAAEALPFPAERFDMDYTKSVLIHTRLPEALAESRRVLRQGGAAIFMEPTNGNPFVRLYRALLAPREWDEFTRYFDDDAAAEVRRAFPASEVRPFYLLGFLAFVWQFKWPVLPLFRAGLALARIVDTPLFALIPPLRKRAWFWVFVGRK